MQKGGEIMDFNEFNVKLGKRIAEVRKSQRYTSKAVLALLDKKGAWLTHREKGRVETTVRELSDIADVLKVPLSSFFEF
jgi:transcriptional regulator with XRE-family HTH domain